MSATNASDLYCSQYRHARDDKGRLQVPARWRNGEAETCLMVIEWKEWIDANTSHPCLLVVPPAVWERLVESLKALPFGDPISQKKRRLVGKRSQRVAIDKAGRINIPDEMLQKVGIQKEAIFVGLLDRFQIWDPDRYKEIDSEDDKFEAEAFQSL